MEGIDGIIFIIILYMVISTVVGSRKNKQDAQTRAMQEKLEKEQSPGLNLSGHTQTSAAPQQKKAPMQAPVLEREALKSAIEAQLHAEGRSTVPLRASASVSAEDRAAQGRAAVKPVPTAAAGLKAQDLRRMIMMKEILDKPVSLRHKTGAAR